ncbi:OTU family cysteine protease [Besnoitia besnoiti]|uniref:Ubiquitin thioesterase OTU n=1 Tax=Besnoitia besnoiti TaxID=94643 RepID=A0A2A9LY35_BESBE|nr:OTU family cysteine protease [Besnoitia besnoiti]PFH31368.1 OTU family cysteine protease [Besnoitia besnoiti]
MEVIVRCSNTRHRVTLPIEATVEDLLLRVRDLTGLSPSRQILKIGYPPQPVALGEESESRSLADAGVKSKDLIIVEERKEGMPLPAGRRDLSSVRAASPPPSERSHEPQQRSDAASAGGDQRTRLLRNGEPSLREQRDRANSTADGWNSAFSSGVRTPDCSASAALVQAPRPPASLSASTASATPLSPPPLSASRLAASAEAGGGTPGIAPPAHETQNGARAGGDFGEAAKSGVASAAFVGEAFRCVVPSDNSCLFTCLSMLAARDKSPQDLRNLVAAAIESDPESFSDAILERPRAAYIQWITTRTSWGGYVELAILAQELRHEVVVLDIETMRKDVYGDRRSGRRVYLLYDGVHYDAVLAKPVAGVLGASIRDVREDERRTGGAFFSIDSREPESLFCYHVFAPDDVQTEAKVVALAAELHKQRSFVSMKQMSFHCLVCGAGIRSQEEMREHARETGHGNFGEARR